ncbi:CPBP family intramembrane metalloprotease [Halobacteria archaeon HArc-gm2]|nr:CPBP family intramembrane metalloprotease [Halobacteria archaeon HArc-gm2]
MESTGAAVDRVDERLLVVSLFGAVAVISGAFLLAVIFQSVVALALGVQSPEAIQGQPGLYTVLSASTFVGFIVAAVGFLSIREEWDVLHVRRPTLRDVAFVVVGLLALAIAATVTSALVSAIIAVLDSAFGVDAQFATNEVIETGQRNPTTFLYMIPVAILLVGPGEELVFRGVVQGLLRRAVGVVPAILLASLLFGLGHYLAIASGNAWTYVFVAGAMGIVLGAIYEYTENIAVPVAIHGLWNAAIFANQWANATGASLPF